MNKNERLRDDTFFRPCARPNVRRKALASAIAALLAGGGPVLAADVCGPGATTIDAAQALNDNCVLDNAGDSVAVEANGTIETNAMSSAVTVDGGVSAGSIDNAGTLSSALQEVIAILTGGSITGGITNSGTLSSGPTTAAAGIGLAQSATVAGGIVNSGTITGRYGVGANASSTIDSISNLAGGEIGANETGVILLSSTVSGAIDNAGLISAGLFGVALWSGSTVGSLTNSGTIQVAATGASGIGIYSSSQITGSLVNEGTIFGGNAGIGIWANSEVGDIDNSGAITGGFTGITIWSGSHVGDITNSGTISGSTTGIDVLSSEVGSITNSGTITGDTIEGGTTGIGISIWSSSQLSGIDNSGTISGGSYAIYISSDSTLTGGITNSGLLDGKVELGGSTLDLDGNSARITGEVSGDGSSIVNINGSFTSENTFDVGIFNIQNGGLFNMAHGVSVQTDDVQNLGTLAVAAGDTATITGGYNQDAAGTFRTGVESDISYGKLQISGTATLPANARIDVDIVGTPALTDGATLSGVLDAGLLTSDGTFDVTDNSALYRFTGAKNGNAVDLTVEAFTVRDLVSGTGFTPAFGAAAVFDDLIANGGGTADMDDVIEALVSLATGQEVADALAQTLPLVTGGMNIAMSSIQHSVNRIVQTGQAGERGMASGNGAPAERYFWLKPFGTWSEQDERKGVPGFDADTYGLALGGDTALSAHTRGGGAFAYSQSSVDSNSAVASNSADVTSYHGILYGSHRLATGSEADLQADVGFHDSEAKRRIQFGGINRVARADYTGWSAHVGAGISHGFKLGNKTRFTPSLRADYSRLRSESYNERGAGALNLRVKQDTTRELIVGVAGKLSHQLGQGTTLVARLGVGHDLLSERGSITASYAGGGAAFATRGIDPSATLVYGGIELVSDLGHGIEVSASYDFERREDFDQHAGFIKLRWPF